MSEQELTEISLTNRLLHYAMLTGINKDRQELTALLREAAAVLAERDARVRELEAALTDNENAVEHLFLTAKKRLDRITALEAQLAEAQKAVAYWQGSLKRENALYVAASSQLQAMADENDSLWTANKGAASQLQAMRTALDWMRESIEHEKGKDPWCWYWPGGVSPFSLEALALRETQT